MHVYISVSIVCVYLLYKRDYSVAIYIVAYKENRKAKQKKREKKKKKKKKTTSPSPRALPSQLVSFFLLPLLLLSIQNNLNLWSFRLLNLFLLRLHAVFFCQDLFSPFLRPMSKIFGDFFLFIFFLASGEMMALIDCLSVFFFTPPSFIFNWKKLVIQYSTRFHQQLITCRYSLAIWNYLTINHWILANVLRDEESNELNNHKLARSINFSKGIVCVHTHSDPLTLDVVQ